MADGDRLPERGRSSEAAWAHREEQAAFARLRDLRFGEDVGDVDLRRMATVTGVRDEGILQTLRALGFTGDSVALVFLIPAVRMAWLEGGVTRRERATVLDMARAGGIMPGAAEYRRLESWLDEQPPPSFYTDTLGVLSRMFDALPVEQATELRNRVRLSCERVARRSGGFLGIGSIAPEERDLLRLMLATAP